MSAVPGTPTGGAGGNATGSGGAGGLAGGPTASSTSIGLPTSTGGSAELGGAPASGGTAEPPLDLDAAAPSGSGNVDSNGCPSSALFCDDFEASSSFGSAWTSRLNGDGTVTIDTAQAHSGMNSVHVNATGYQTFVALAGAPVFPAPETGLYVRVYIRLAVAMPTGHNTYFEAGPTGDTDAQHETRVGVQQAMLMVNQPAGDRAVLSNQNYYTDMMIGPHLEAEQWACLEVFFHPAASELRAWLDGAEIGDLHLTDWQQDPLGELRFGYEKYAGPNAEIWYDDIAVSGEQIGCE